MQFMNSVLPCFGEREQGKAKPRVMYHAHCYLIKYCLRTEEHLLQASV